jgi:hypothetical protein
MDIKAKRESSEFENRGMGTAKSKSNRTPQAVFTAHETQYAWLFPLWKAMNDIFLSLVPLFLFSNDACQQFLPQLSLV